MANLPAERPKSSLPDRVYESIVDALARGHSPAAIAKKLHPKDLKKRKAMRMRIHRMARTDPAFQAELAGRAKGDLMLAVPASATALAKRAERGRPDAIKLLFEATGFHNTKVKHEHSGEVKVVVEGIPRPAPVETVDSTGEIMDADVVS